MKSLVVRGAREHNLQDLTLHLPRDRLIVVTGPSGSGKSSLAFDTIYAEGQRRYVESLSAYARQFLERLPKPDVDIIEGLSPAISIEQRTPTRNPRSTVGTITEIHDYLRLLFARAGQPHCPRCGAVVDAQTIGQMTDRVLQWPAGTRFAVLAPVVRGKKGAFQKLLEGFRKEGFVRVRIDGEVRDLGEDIELARTRAHDVDLFVDRLSVKPEVRSRLAEGLELAASLADGLVKVARSDGEELLLSERFACARCGISLPELTPRTFSFNSPEGACPTCAGLGRVRRFEPELVIADPSLSLNEGAVAPWGKPGKAWHRQMLAKAVGALGVNPDVPWLRLPEPEREALLHGRQREPTYEGILPWLERRVREYDRRKREEGLNEERAFEFLEQELGQYATWRTCDTCAGARLRPEALAVTVAGHDLHALSQLPVHRVRDVLASLDLDVQRTAIAERLLREVDQRLGFMVDVGLDYLALGRSAATLSAGEAQRIRLATQIGAALAGVLYVLDEPSIGLHPRDNARLIGTLQRLRDRGNTVLVVEHDADTIRAADHVVDMGPGAGREGGRVIASGTPSEIAEHRASSTGAFLSGRRDMPVPARRRSPKRWVTVRNARTHNLKDVTVAFPLGVLTCVTGVSGSGKSSLVMDTLLPLLRSGSAGPGTDATIDGAETVERVIQVDQSPIGRTPRSNPATYTGIFAPIRELFATLPDARARGYKPGRFSFNVKGGRCEACQGAGVVRIEMHFLPDVFVTCEQCGGRRYNRETLEVRYRGRSIADILAMPVDEALPFFDAVPRVRDGLAALRSVGLGYLELGRNAATLSGGEAQRIKLAREIGRRVRGHTLYVLDEPTTGLHFVDVEVLVQVLGGLVDAGHSVVVVEHHMGLVKGADHVIDLGPEGGEAGGEVVVAGAPETVARAPESHTGRYLGRALGL
ncbi:MAG: excinuclease ABC subunit UvrA [Myxococcota bacterium]